MYYNPKFLTFCSLIGLLKYVYMQNVRQTDRQGHPNRPSGLNMAFLLIPTGHWRSQFFERNKSKLSLITTSKEASDDQKILSNFIHNSR